jgi:hypothetical protein
MAGPLVGAAEMSDSSHHRSLVAAITEVEEDVDDKPPRGAVGIPDSSHHRS